MSAVFSRFDQRIFERAGPSELARAADFSSDLRLIQRLFIKGLGRDDFIAQLASLPVQPQFLSSEKTLIAGALTKGRDFVMDRLGLEMVWVEPGTFWMGSPKNEPGRDDDERQHRVTLTRGYWLGRTEVTQEPVDGTDGRQPQSLCGGGQRRSGRIGELGGGGWSSAAV